MKTFFSIDSIKWEPDKIGGKKRKNAGSSCNFEEYLKNCIGFFWKNWIFFLSEKLDLGS
jgi:hypothetical protein